MTWNIIIYSTYSATGFMSIVRSETNSFQRSAEVAYFMGDMLYLTNLMSFTAMLMKNFLCKWTISVLQALLNLGN